MITRLQPRLEDGGQPRAPLESNARRSPVGVRRLVWLLPLFLAAALVACGGDGSSADQTSPSTTAPNASIPAPAESTTSRPSGTNTAPSPAAANAGVEPNGARIYEDVRLLSLSPRSSGTQLEKEAADFIAERLRGLGYDVSLQEFTVDTAARDSVTTITVPFIKRLPNIPFQRSGSGLARGTVVATGIGRPGDFPSEARNSIALIERGEILFNEKLINAQAAGVKGVIIYNSEPGIFQGTLAQDSRIPAVSISREDGQELLAQMKKGRVEIELDVGGTKQGTSQNVVAKPPGRECATVTGGHYDSVPQAAGASDNATGTATVLEIAAVMAGKGEMGSHCFVLFGSEELGLLGSRHYVQQLDAESKGALKAMLNFDMVGVGTDSWQLIGSSEMQQRAGVVTQSLGIQAARGQLGGLSSDHASFQGAGIPAFMLHRLTDRLLHTPQDTIERVDPALLEQAAKIGVAMLESLGQGG